MARAGNTKKTSKFVVRKAAGSSAGKKAVPKSRAAASKSTARKTSSSVKSLKKPKILSRISSRVKTVRRALVKAAKKLSRKLPTAKKTSAVKVPAKKTLKKKVSVKKPALVKKAKPVKETVPMKKPAPAPVSGKKPQKKSPVRPEKAPVKLSRKEVQKPSAPKAKAALPAAEKKNVRRVKATDRSRGLAKKEAKVPFGDLRVAMVKKPVYSKIADAQNRKPAAVRKASPAKMAVKKKTAVPAASAPAPVPVREFPQELPSNYGDNLIYLMVRDPHWIYAYWELQKDYVEGSRESLGGSWGEICTVLRVYDVTDSQSEPAYQDLYLGGITDHWHINAVPDRSYFVEIGLLHKDGRFLSLARSNSVLMPRDSMSDVLDEQWMDIDFDKVYALSGGFDVGKSSQELRKLMQDRMQGNASSGSGSGVGIVTSMSSPGSGSWGGQGLEAMKARKFFFWLDCEVIVYGGTEPDAKVTFQGKVIKLRPDGTFSFRFALPDGNFVFDAKAESSDGIEERVITPVVQRETSRPAPVFKQGKV